MFVFHKIFTQFLLSFPPPAHSNLFRTSSTAYYSLKRQPQDQRQHDLPVMAAKLLVSFALGFSNTLYERGLRDSQFSNQLYYGSRLCRLLPSQKGNRGTWTRIYPFICLAHRQTSKSLLIYLESIIIQSCSSLVHSHKLSFCACPPAFSQKSLVITEAWFHAISAGYKWKWESYMFVYFMNKQKKLFYLKHNSYFLKRGGLGEKRTDSLCMYTWKDSPNCL